MIVKAKVQLNLEQEEVDRLFQERLRALTKGYKIEGGWLVDDSRVEHCLGGVCSIDHAPVKIAATDAHDWQLVTAAIRLKEALIQRGLWKGK